MEAGRGGKYHHGKQTPFRKATVKKIMGVKKKDVGLTRQSQFLAVSIVDKFECCCGSLEQHGSYSVKQAHIFAAASLFLACKYEYMASFVFQKIRDWFFENQPKESSFEKIAEAQYIILETIDYLLPLETPFICMEKSHYHDRQSGTLIQKQVKKALKILILAIEDWPILSSSPQIGNQIYSIATKDGKGSKRAKQIYMAVRADEKRMSPKSQKSK